MCVCVCVCVCVQKLPYYALDYLSMRVCVCVCVCVCVEETFRWQSFCEGVRRTMCAVSIVSRCYLPEE